MSLERIAIGTGLGFASSLISGALDLNEVHRGEHLGQNLFNTAAWLGTCIVASEFLSVPGFAPVSIALFLRLHRIGIQVSNRVAELTKKE
jgi:hypothetical protein